MMETIRFTLNQEATTLDTDPARTLLWVLRTDLGLTGTKYGCGQGHCGACTVIVDGEAMRSCQLTIGDVAGRDVLTIEGLERVGRLHRLQEQFIEHDALQCGFCTPGMILNAYALLLRNPHPTREEIVLAMDDNLCRCGAHQRILAAIESAAERM